ncbi:MAG: MFS transporter [Myxococcota bacterium]
MPSTSQDTPDATVGPVRPLAPFRERRFLACFATGTLAASGNWMLSLSVPYLVYELTRSSAWLGVAAVASNLPSLIASPVGGVFADRYAKRTLLLVAGGIQVALALVLFATSRAGLLDIRLLIGLAAAMGFASATQTSVYQSFVAEIVQARHISAAYRLNAIQFNVSRAIGPAVAGLVLHRFGPTTAFLVNALSFAPLLCVLAVIRTRDVQRSVATSVAGEIVEGALVVWRDHRLRIAVLTGALCSMFGMSIYSLAAGLAKDVFHVDEAGLGLLVSSIGLMSFLTALLAVSLGDRLRRSTLVTSGLVLYGLGLQVVAATDVFAVGLLGFGITGIAHVMVNVSVTTTIQQYVAPEFRGRVTSFQLLGIMLSLPIGAQLGGLAADFVGLPAVVAAYGGVQIACGLWAKLRMGGLREID